MDSRVAFSQYILFYVQKVVRPRVKTIFFASMFSLMRINLHEEAKQLINSMAASEMPQLRSQPSCVSIVEANHEASTLSELRRLFLRESAAQEVFVDLVGNYLDEVVKSNDQYQARNISLVFPP
jgi:hypothetical protein